MKKKFAGIFLFGSFFIFGVCFLLPSIHKSRYQKAENLELYGVVTHIEWKTKNHALPLFRIKGSDKSEIKLNDGELILTKGQLVVGDTISKKSGSRYCQINTEQVECVQEFIELLQVVSLEFKSE